MESQIKVGDVVVFAPGSFFAERNGVLNAKVRSIHVGLSREDPGFIEVICLEGTDCYLSPGETETFPYFGYNKVIALKGAD